MSPVVIRNPGINSPFADRFGPQEHRLFFCQIEVLETAIYLAEVAGKVGDSWIESHLREELEEG